MKLKNLNNIIAALLLFCFISYSAYAQSLNEVVSLNDLIQEAQHNNPKIQEAFHNWKAAEYKVKSAKSLDDPMFSYGYFGESVQTRVGPQDQKFGVSQKIPFPGKRHIKGKAQSKQAEILKEKYEATKNEITKEIKFVYYDLYWIDKSIKTNEEEKAILEGLERSAQLKYESNQAPQQDVIRVQMEISKVIQNIFMLTQNRKSLNFKLKSLINKNTSSDFDVVTKLERNDFDYPLNAIIEKSKTSRQELKSAHLDIERAEYEKSLARMNYLPDFTFGAEFVDIGGGTTSNTNDGQDAWMAMVSVNVPIWFGKLHAQLNEKKELLKASEEKKTDFENQVEYEVTDLYYKINAYKDIVLLYETALMPQSQQALNVAQTAFETNEIEFLNWLEVQRTNLQIKLAYYKSLVDYQKSIAYLERVIGEKL